MFTDDPVHDYLVWSDELEGYFAAMTCRECSRARIPDGYRNPDDICYCTVEEDFVQLDTQACDYFAEN